ncbi:MAG: hypothetical protein ABSE25_03500 [Syntrophorhabdales bacterium]
MKDVLLIVNGAGSERAVEAAFSSALAGSGRVVALQLLTSDLYHYGHNDLVATRPSKAQFLLYIREEVVEQARQQAEGLRRKAAEAGVTLEVRPVETEDAASAVLGEAEKGYRAVFIAKEKKKLFPLLKRPLARALRAALKDKVIEC